MDDYIDGVFELENTRIYIYKLRTILDTKQWKEDLIKAMGYKL